MKLKIMINQKKVLNPVYTFFFIDVERYKKLNKDISEKRFYYTPEKKLSKKNE